MAPFKTLPLCFLLAATLLAGCTHTRVVSNDADADYNFAMLHETLEGRQVDIQLSDERTIASKALLIRPDSTWSIDLLNGGIRSAATHDISSVIWTRPDKGAVEGAMLGAAAGAIVGLATGLALTSVRDADEAQTSLAHYISVPTVFFSILGIGTGTVLGVQKGSRDRYVYPQLPYERQTNAVAPDAENVGQTAKHR